MSLNSTQVDGHLFFFFIFPQKIVGSKGSREACRVALWHGVGGGTRHGVELLEEKSLTGS